jgi:hypothetical protein
MALVSLIIGIMVFLLCGAIVLSSPTTNLG